MSTTSTTDRTEPPAREEPATPIGAANLGLLAGADEAELACVDEGLVPAGIDTPTQAEWPGSPADVEAAFDVALDCLDGGVRHPIFVEHVERLLERALSWVVDLDLDQASCAIDALDAEGQATGAVLGGRSEGAGEILGRSVSQCATSEQVDALVTYSQELKSGDEDGRIGELIRGCSTAYRQECDVLQLLAPEGVDGGWAKSCGGSPASATGFCAIEIDLDITGYSPVSNPGLVVLENSCNDGRLNSCDSLRAIAPVGSPLLMLGRTCAGRIPEGAVPDCRSAYSGGREG